MCTDRVRNDEVLHRDKEERNIIHTLIKRKANWISHILSRKHLLKHATGGKRKGGIEVTKRQGRRRKQLLDDLMETRVYCKFKEEAPDCSIWRTRFERSYGPRNE